MSKKDKAVKTQEEVEVMQTAGVTTQETEEVSTALATEIIADLKKERDDLQENLDICAGLADRYMYRQGIIECALKLKNERLLRCAYAYMKKLSEGEE